MQHEQVTLLKWSSMWLTTNVLPEDIEHERQQLEAEYRVSIALHHRETVMRSGVPCTRVEWKVI